MASYRRAHNDVQGQHASKIRLIFILHMLIELRIAVVVMETDICFHCLISISAAPVIELLQLW